MKLNSGINAKTVQFISEEDYYTDCTKIQGRLVLRCQHNVPNITLMMSSPDELLRLSNVIHAELLMSLRCAVLGGEERSILNMRDECFSLLYDMAHSITDYQTQKSWETLRDLIGGLFESLLYHEDDRHAFQCNQAYQPSGEIDCAYTNSEGNSSSSGQGGNVCPNVGRIGTHPGEEDSTDGTLLPPPDMDA